MISPRYRKSLSDLYAVPENSMVQASLVAKDFIASVSWPEIFLIPSSELHEDPQSYGV